MSFVVVETSDGIFLGLCLGLAFWSKLDSAGQIAAPSFTEDQADSFIAACVKVDKEHNIVKQYRKVKVTPDVNGKYCSKQACVAAGLDNWE
jgi:hypothetical protein